MTASQFAITLLTGVTGTLGFSLIFRVDNKKLVPACFCGLISTGVLLLCTRFSSDLFISSFAAALALSVFAEILCRKLRAPVITFLTPGLIPLVPGRSLYYSMRHLIYSDYIHFFEHVKIVVQVALGISVGIMLASVISIIFFNHSMLFVRKKK